MEVYSSHMVVAAMLPNVVLHVVDILGLDRIDQNVDNLDLAWVPFAVDSFLYSVCLIFPITTIVVSSNLDQGEVYNVM
jgi:hypothetical protein